MKVGCQERLGIDLRVRVKISSQIFSVEAPAWQGAKVQEYLAYSELSQRCEAGCIGAKNVKLFLCEPLVHTACFAFFSLLFHLHHSI